jgi:hypothetical protein
MTLLDVLQNQLDRSTINQLSNEIGADPAQTEAATSGVFATLLGGLAQNATSPDGLQSLGNALDRDHDGSVLGNILGVLGGVNQGVGSPKALDGAGILGHILGGRQEPVAEQIGARSGLRSGQVIKLMMMLAPLVMGVLGRTRREGNLDLGSLARVLLGSARSAQSQPGIGDLLGSVLGGGLGSILGGSGGGGLGGVLGGDNEAQSTYGQPARDPRDRDGDGDVDADDQSFLQQVLGGIFGRR